MPSGEHRPLLQIGLSTWVALIDINAVEWDNEERCPKVILTSGMGFPASFFSIVGMDDTPELRTSALIRLIRMARKRNSDMIDANSLLTTRETEVLEFLSRGESNEEIAKELYMADSTVKSHISKIYSKLGVKNRTGAVMAAIHLGIIDSDPNGEKPGDGSAGARY